MPIVVKALPEDEFKAWLAEKKGGGEQVAAAATTSVMPAAATMTDAAPAAEAPVEVAAVTPAPAAAAPAAAAGRSKEDLVAHGEKVYKGNCAACHQVTGAGMPPTFPALVGSKVATGPKAGAIAQVLKGKNMMPPFSQLSDDDIAGVLTYVASSWGNKGEIVQAADVAAARK